MSVLDPSLRQLDWDDLRVALAVARAGSLSGAARSLGVNHTTVSRRLSATEERVGVRLFERMAGAWAPTEAGDALVRAAERMEEEVATASRQVLGRDARLQGQVRVAVSDIWALFLMPVFEAFSRRYPEIELELVAANTNSSLTRREADVAIRVTDRPDEPLVGRRLSRIASAVYGSRSYLERHPVDQAVCGHRWVGWDTALPIGDFQTWLRAVDPEAVVSCRVNTGEMMLGAVRAGLGLARMICAPAEADPELVRVSEPELGRSLWLLTHEDLRRTARIRAFLDFTAEKLGELRPRIEGREPRSAAST
jgi:DNA-binding transcriptional LysR family regulator